jgi:hypothetical protein
MMAAGPLQELFEMSSSTVLTRLQESIYCFSRWDNDFYLLVSRTRAKTIEKTFAYMSSCRGYNSPSLLLDLSQ